MDIDKPKKYLLMGFFSVDERPNSEIIQETYNLREIDTTITLLYKLREEMEYSKTTSRSTKILRCLKKAGISPIHVALNGKEYVIRPSKFAAIVDQKLIFRKSQIPVNPEK